MTFDIWYILVVLGGQVPHIVMLVFNALYVAKKRSIDGILMLIGGILGLLLSLLHTFGIVYMLQNRDAYDVEGITRLTSGVSFIFNIIYMVGFILLMIKVSKPDAATLTTQHVDLIEPGQ
jgi:hypothetical protein